jgi:hypothetical protein
LERSHLNLENVSTRLAESHAEYFISGFLRGFEEMLLRVQAETGEILEAEVVQEITSAGARVAQEYLETVTTRPE